MKTVFAQSEAYESPKAEMIDFTLEGGLLQIPTTNSEGAGAGPEV